MWWKPWTLNPRSLNLIMLNSAAYYRLGIQFRFMSLCLLWSNFNNFHFPPLASEQIFRFDVITNFYHLRSFVCSQMKITVENDDHYLITFPPKQTLISSSSFMCHTFSSSFERNLQFYAHHQRLRFQPHLIFRICYKFSMAFRYHCCVFVSLFPASAQRRQRQS